METELIKKQLQEIRKNIKNAIIGLLSEFKLDSIEIAEIDECDAPVLPLPDEYDSSCQYSLDRLYIRENQIVFEGSSQASNVEYDSDCLDVESMLGILDWLESHRQEIGEYAEDKNEDIPGNDRLFVFRFHRDAWTDIKVMAPDEDTALERAEEKYNAGDYEDTDEDFENTNVDNVTNEYVKD